MADESVLPEVTRFVVKLPLSYAGHSRDLRAKLDAEFPDRTFTLEMLSSSAEKKLLALLPVMEDKAGKPQICRLPGRSLTSRIYEVLNEFVCGIEATPA